MASPGVRELVRRALFGINAARRIAKDVAAGSSVSDALAKERSNFESHKQAQKRRFAVDDAMEASRRLYGDTLGWYLDPQENNCPICKKLDGKNFNARTGANGLFPGSAHPNCQCSSGAPFPGARTL